MKRTETKTFTAQVYELTGKSFLCPDHTIKTGDKVIAKTPLKKIDPLGYYAFVQDGTQTQSVSAKFLDRVGKRVKLTYERPMFSTAAQETVMELEAMNEYLKSQVLEVQ